MKFFYITILVLSLNGLQGYSNYEKSIQSILQGYNDQNTAYNSGTIRHFQPQKLDYARDAKVAKQKANILKKVRTHAQTLNVGTENPSSKQNRGFDKQIGAEFFKMDPILNKLTRRSYDGKVGGTIDLKDWRDRFHEDRIQKKLEALNATGERGDVVNMVAARPWGVPCGDPNQHDMPTGSCTLQAECDAEYRVPRGDFFCGRTVFVCCGLLHTTYDLYQGLDISFEGSSFSTDSVEIENALQGIRKKKKEQRARKRNAREKQKREIKKTIRKTVAIIRKIMHKAWRNGSTHRKRKTKQLQTFINLLKTQYRKDRKSVINVHEYEMVKLDKVLQARLNDIRGVNSKFMSNDTYRDIIKNGTNPDKIRKLLRKRPKLARFLAAGRRTDVRIPVETTKKPVLVYDLEYY